MIMKKFIALACAAVLTVASAVTAFAQPSVSVSGVVTAITTATDKDGKAVNATFGEVPAEYANAVAEVKTAEKLKELLGSDYASTMQVVDVKNVTVPDGTVFPVTITFKVTGVTASTKVAVLHYNTTTKTWEKVESKAGDGTVTATFTSLSPVAFVVDKATAASTTTNKGTTTTTNKGTTSSTSTTGSKTASSTTSPKTGETNVMVYAGIVAVAAVAGMAVTRRKRA
jgi:LPXTG-motif cell wall-anchored protein